MVSDLDRLNIWVTQLKRQSDIVSDVSQLSFMNFWMVYTRFSSHEISEEPHQWSLPSNGSFNWRVEN